MMPLLDPGMESLNHCKEKQLHDITEIYIYIYIPMLSASKLVSAVDRRLMVKIQKCMRCTTAPKKGLESKKNWSPS